MPTPHFSNASQHRIPLAVHIMPMVRTITTNRQRRRKVESKLFWITIVVDASTTTASAADASWTPKLTAESSPLYRG